MASPKPTSASAIIAALKEYGIEFTPAREKALLKTINTLFKTQTSDQVSTYVATKVAFITKQLKAIGLDTGLGDANGDGKISTAELAALKAEIKASAKTAADTGSAPGDTTTVSLTGDKSSATEGKDTVTYTVKGAAGSSYTWTVDDTHVNDVVTAAGTVTIGANGEGTFTVVAKQDNVTESAEVVKVTLLDNTATVVANTNLIIQEDPGAAAALSVDATSITEGGTAATFTVTGLVGATYTWTVDGTHVGDVDSAGNVVTLVAGPDGKGTATFTVSAKQDNTAESAEVTTISLLDGTGVVVATRSVTIVEDPLVGATFTLTTSVDNVTGTAANDTFKATDGAVNLSALDKVDGGAGTADKLTVVQTTAINIPSSVSVSNIEIAELTSGAAITKADTSTWTGLTKLTTISSAGANIKASSDTEVVVTDDAAGTVTVDGGSSQTVTAVGEVDLSHSSGAVVVTATKVAATDSVINDGTSITYTGSGITSGGSLLVGTTTAPSGAVLLDLSGAITAATSSVVEVDGGTTITISDLITNSATTGTATTGNIDIFGSAETTTVSITQEATVAVAAAVVKVTEVKSTAATTAGDVTTAGVAAVAAIGGVAAGAVAIEDLTTTKSTQATTLGTIKSVSLENYGNSTIKSNALDTLSLTGTAGTLGITTGLTTPTNTTLNLTVNGLSGANTITDSTAGAGKGYTTLNIATATADSKIADIAAVDVTALNVSGTNTLTLTSAAGLTTLATVKVTGAAGLNATVSQATVTDVNASASTGNNTIVLDATKATFEGGSGVDTVTIAAVSTKVIDGGAGTADVLVVNAASYAANATKNINFEVLKQGTAASGAFDATGFTALQAGALTGASSFTNVAAGVGLTVTGALGAVETVTLANAAGASDVFNLGLQIGATGANSVSLAGVETVNVAITDTDTVAHTTYTETLTITDTSATAINITGTGNVKLALVQASTALTSVDASGLTGAGFNWTSGNLAAAATIKGSVANANNVDLGAAATAIVTYVGGSGNDNLVLSTAGKANVVTLGDGTNVVTGATTGNNTITGGAGDDSFVTALGGNNTINFGNGANAFTATTGNNTYVGGTGVDTVTVGGGVNTITTGAGADVVTITAVAANGNSYTTITDAHADLKLVSTDAGQASGTTTFTTAKITLAETAVFQDFLDAATVSALTATNSNVAWFQFGGNTYVVEDNSAALTFQNNADTVIKLTGLQDLSDDTFAATASTSWSLTLV